MLVCHDASRGYIYRGLRYAQLLDTITDSLKKHGIVPVTIASPISYLGGKKAYGNVFLVNSLFVHANFLEWLGKLLFLKQRGVRTASIDTWRSIILKINPKVIIGIQPSPSLCVAAESLGVWVADLQHGVISDQGYYGNQDRATIQQRGWPSCILCWDEHSANKIRLNTKNSIPTITVGNPWILRFLDPSPDDSLVSEAASEVNLLKKERPVILVTLQWGYEHLEKHHATGMPTGLIDFIKNQGSDYDWWIRLHPILKGGRKEKALKRTLKKEFYEKPHVSWELPTRLALPVVLSYVDLHITSSSAVTIEASWFGIKTALLGAQDDAISQWFFAEIASKDAEIIPNNACEIKFWVERNLRSNQKKRRLSQYQNNYEKLINLILQSIA